MQRDSISSAVAMGGVNLIILLIVISFMSGGKESENSNTLKPVRIATGEWAPYSGEDLAELGIASAIVTAALNNAGYTPEYEFTPWPLAESVTRDNQTNNSVRATFPFLYTENRSHVYYYSVPILEVDYSLYFNACCFKLLNDPILDERNISVFYKLDHFTNSINVKTLARLKEMYKSSILDEGVFMKLFQVVLWLETLNLSIVPILGYEVNDALQPYLAKIDPVRDNTAAFELLKEYGDKYVVIEATSVGDKLLMDSYPINYSIRNDIGSTESPDNRIVSASINISLPVYLIAGKRNPHNLRFIEDFNTALNKLQAAGSVEKIESRISKAIRKKNLVRLQPFDEQDFLIGKKIDSADPFIYIIKGTKARIVKWNHDFLVSHASKPEPNNSYPVKVMIEQGPHSGTTVVVDSRSIEIP